LLPPDTEIVPPETPAKPSFQLPAEYYSTPVSAKPLVASWVPFGCGGAALFFLVILFVGGTLISGDTLSGLFDFTFSQMQPEIERTFASDVSPAQRAAFAAEMNTTRANIRAKKIDFRSMQPLMETMKDAMSDKLVNAAETEQLMREMRKANAEAAKPRPKKSS